MLGQVMAITMRVKNNTKQDIKSIKFLSDATACIFELKKIGCGLEKQIGIPTIREISSLKMVVDDVEVFINRKFLRGDMNKYCLEIKDISNLDINYDLNICEF